jgi:putative acetyltransferase
MHIEPLDPESAAARSLIAEADAYMKALYPAVSNHLAGIPALKLPNVLFLGCHIEGELAACGAVRTRTDDGIYGEIKRIFVLARHRGKGLSKAIMLRLEAHLQVLGIDIARLETGIKQPEALGLYTKLGYAVRGPFSDYRSDPLSVFMEKRLDARVFIDSPN